jgi:hypothetical protein
MVLSKAEVDLGCRVERSGPETGGNRAKVLWSGVLGNRPKPMLARQTVDLGALKSAISGWVTVYLPWKSTVYRQVYRHPTVAIASFSETMVDSRLAKNRIISMIYSRPETQ